MPGSLPAQCVRLCLTEQLASQALQPALFSCSWKQLPCEKAVFVPACSLAYGHAFCISCRTERKKKAYPASYKAYNRSIDGMWKSSNPPGCKASCVCFYRAKIERRSAIRIGNNISTMTIDVKLLWYNNDRRDENHER